MSFNRCILCRNLVFSDLFRVVVCVVLEYCVLFVYVWTLLSRQTCEWGHFGRCPNLSVSGFATCWKSSWPPQIVHPKPRDHLMRALLESGRHRSSRPTSECILCAEWMCTVCWVTVYCVLSEYWGVGSEGQTPYWWVCTVSWVDVDCVLSEY